VLVSAARITGGGLGEVDLVALKEPTGKQDQPLKTRIVDLGYGCPRVYPLHEEGFSFVDVADTGQIPLVEQSRADLAGGIGGDAADHLGDIKVWTQQIRP
jgi:hypothetical protein